MKVKKKLIVVIVLIFICILLVNLVKKESKTLKDYGGMPSEMTDKRSTEEEKSELDKEEELEEIKKKILQEYSDVTESELGSDSEYYIEYMDGGE